MTYTPFPEPKIPNTVQNQEETLEAPVISDEIKPQTEETIVNSVDSSDKTSEQTQTKLSE